MIGILQNISLGFDRSSTPPLLSQRAPCKLRMKKRSEQG